jgi:hyperosmotically inducible periplasmic protein
MRQRVVVLFVAASTILAVACSQSDVGITTAVKAKFAQDEIVKAYQIDVDTSNRVVTLKGTVQTTAAKEQAITLARQTEGVRDVVDQITVNPQTATTAGDFENRAKQAAQEIGASTREAAARAGQFVEDEAREAVKATGNAARDAAQATGDAARLATASAADRTQAVVTDAAITSAVKTKLLADATVPGLKINVNTTSGVVTLHGTVDSQAEATRAVALARETSNVSKVVDNIKVAVAR